MFTSWTSHLSNGSAAMTKAIASCATGTGSEILGAVGQDIQVVMIGEASHGTHEFYRIRAEITKQLIVEKGFNLVCWEADFPDTERVNRYVLGSNVDKNSIEALGTYERFSKFMWRNEVVADFVEWLREHNCKTDKKVTVHGLGLYSLENSRDEVIGYLRRTNPKLAEQARAGYKGSNKYRVNSSAASSMIRELERLEQQKPQDDELFAAAHNARCVRAAAEYYAASPGWNYRDTFMTETLVRLMQRKTAMVGEAKAAVWAHNSHLGDARQTYMMSRGKINIGKLVREHFGMDKVMNIGFTSHTGSVTASSEWDEDAEFKSVNPSMRGSVERVLHEATEEGRLGNEWALIFRSTGSQENVASAEVIEMLGRSFEQRAIGVVYRPDTERQSHYFEAKTSKQFDILIHVDEMNALRPLDITEVWAEGEQMYMDTD